MGNATTGVQTAMVLAAGQGQRMRPLTAVLPKPALPLPGGPVIAWPLRLAAAVAEQRLVVNTWHLAEGMEHAIHQTELPRIELLISRETTLMGTAGGLALARDRGLLTGDPVLVLNGDVVPKLDLQPLLERHRHSDDLVTLALLPHPDPFAWSRVICDGHGRVRGFLPAGAPKPGEEPFLYPGAMLVSGSLLAGLPSGPGETLPLLWKPALRQQRLGAALVSGSWREVGNPPAYLEAVLALLGGGVELAADAVVADTASLDSTLVGPGSRIEAGAEVSESVISHGAVVRAGAQVHRSILLGPVEAAPNEHLSNHHRTPPAI